MSRAGNRPSGGLLLRPGGRDGGVGAGSIPAISRWICAAPSARSPAAVPADHLVDVAAKSPGQEHRRPDHAVFWLVTADQFAKRGIDSPRVCANREASRATMTLGMGPSDLRCRNRGCSRIARPPGERAAAARPNSNSRRAEWKSVIAMPTRPRAAEHQPNLPHSRKIPNWHHDGWAAMIVIARGRTRLSGVVLAFDGRRPLAKSRPRFRWISRSFGCCGGPAL